LSILDCPFGFLWFDCMFLVSLYCPSLIAPSVFSKFIIYLKLDDRSATYLYVWSTLSSKFPSYNDLKILGISSLYLDQTSKWQS
jgi:hypothetical protein